MMKPSTRRTLLAAALAVTFASPVLAQKSDNTIRITGLYELSGAGASAGTMFKNGVALAVKEINESGGILGRRIEHAIAV